MKKKKIYFQNEPIHQMACFGSLFCGIACGSLFVISLIRLIDSQYKGELLSIVVIFMALTVIFIYGFFIMESFNLHLDEEKIWMNDEKIPRPVKIQYKAVAYFRDIKEIKLINTILSSKLNAIRHGRWIDNKRYLVFVTDKGKNVRMNVSHYTDDYLALILSDIILRISLFENCYDGKTVYDILGKN